MEIRIVISIAFMYLTTIMCGAAFFIWMQNQRQEAGCCMICFCMTGIPMQKRRGSVSHGLTHPKTALNHACRLFPLNDIEKDVIRAHMWPVTFFSIPHTKEGWIITLTDKYCGAFESMKRK